MKQPYTVLPDRSSPVEYKLPDIPILTFNSSLALSGYEALCHWHTDIEFFYIYHGTADFFVNGKVVRLNEGEGIFINSRRLHYCFSKEKNDCSYYIVLLDFSVLQQRSVVLDSYMKKKFKENTLDYIVFHPDVPWEQKVLTSIQDIYKAMNEDELNPFRVLAIGCDIYARVSEHIPDSDEDEISFRERMIFLQMTSFIMDSYPKRITLDDIAESGDVCRSKCCQIFQKQVKQSPNDYLIQYRIAKSCELLRNTVLGIGEVAQRCGFQSASYFTKVFHKHTDCSPREYRTRNS